MPTSVTHQGHTPGARLPSQIAGPAWVHARRAAAMAAGRSRYASNCRCATQKRTTSYVNKRVTTVAKVSRNFAPITANTIVSAAYANTAATRKQRCRR